MCANNNLRQVAKLIGTQDDFGAGIRTPSIARVTTPITSNLLVCRFTIEHTPFTGLAFIKRYPLTHEGVNLWLRLVGYRVICQRTLPLVLPPLTCFGVCHLVIIQVRQGYQGRATNPTNYDNLTHLAHQVVRFDRIETTSCRLLEHRHGKIKQVNQRLWSGCPSTHSLQPRTCRANPAHIPRGYCTSIKKRDEFAECLCPTYLTVCNVDDNIRIAEVLTDDRKPVYVLPLNTEAYPCATHQYIHGLIKRTRAVYRNVRTVIATDVITSQSRSSGHHGSHGWHHF